MTRCIYAWMTFVVVVLYSVVSSSSSTALPFFRIGPHDDFLFFGVPIDSYRRYVCLTMYSCLNSIVRTVHKNIVQAAMFNNILNKSAPMTFDIQQTTEISSVSTLYVWFDWFIYMNLTLSQMDMMIIEIVADTLTSIATTFVFMRLKKQTPYTALHSMDDM